MSRVSRGLTAVAGVALFGLAACTGGSANTPGGGSEPAPPMQEKALASFDPCTFFKPDEVSPYGLATQGTQFVPIPDQPGCSWEGDQMSLSLNKNLGQTVENFGTSGTWDKFEPKTIAGRSAAIALEAGAADIGSCTALVNAGGGVVIYMLDGTLRETIPDPCAELEKIVNQTASRLPE